MNLSQWWVTSITQSYGLNKQERHSVLGVFIRRLLLRLRKLSFDETSQLARQIGQWCGHDAGPSRIHVTSLNRRLAMEDSLEKRTAAMQE